MLPDRKLAIDARWRVINYNSTDKMGGDALSINLTVFHKVET